MTALSTFAMLAIMSGITVALILLFKKIAGRKLSPVFHYYIWLLLIIRLMFPVLPQSRLSLFNAFDSFAPLSFDFTEVGKAEFDIALLGEEGMPNGSFTNEGTGSPAASTGDTSGGSSASPYGFIDFIETVDKTNPGSASIKDAAGSVYLLVYIIWGSVSAAVLAFGILKYNIQRRRVLRGVSPCLDKEVLNETEFILAAYNIKRKVKILWGEKSMLLGVLSPVVIIDRTLRPLNKGQGLSANRGYSLVLAHELTHLFRRDNIKNFIYGAFSGIYWFNPLVWIAFSHMRDDAELLCDYTALNRFGLCSGKYADLLFTSVKDSRISSPSAAPAMSKAGKQLIRRLSFISARGRQISLPRRIISAIIIAAIAALCLTNPIAAVKSNNNKINYLEKYRSLLSEASIIFPEPDTRLTVRGFIDSVLLALDTAELPLAVRDRLQTMRSYGADDLLDKMIKQPYRSQAPSLYNGFISSIKPESPVTRQEAAFLLNSMLLLTEREFLVSLDTVPQILSQTDYDYSMASLDNEAAIRKLEAFYTLKSVYTTDNNEMRIYKNDEVSQSHIQSSPLCVIFPLYTFDPYASNRERTMFLKYIDSGTDFHAYQRFASMADSDEYANFITAVPPLLPNVLPADSFNENLMGTINDPALKTELASLYEQHYDNNYPDTPMYILKKTPDYEYTADLTIRILENSKYTYAMMARDQAVCGFDYLSLSRSILPMREYSFTRDDGSVVVYSILGKKEHEYLCSLATPEEKRLLKAYFILKDPNDQSLGISYREKIAQTFQIDAAVYIFDPEATDNERAEIDAIISKYATGYTSVYALPVRMYEAYRDESEIDSSALTAVRCLQSYGVFDANNYFKPNDNVTFADAAEMVVRLYSVLMIY